MKTVKIEAKTQKMSKKAMKKTKGGARGLAVGSGITGGGSED